MTTTALPPLTAGARAGCPTLTDLLARVRVADGHVLADDADTGVDLTTPPALSDATQRLYGALHVMGPTAGTAGTDVLPDHGFERAIAEAVPDFGSTLPCRRLDEHTVQIAGVRVLVPPGVADGATHVSCSSLRPNLSAGFFAYQLGEQGDPRNGSVRVYASYHDPEEALADWAQALRAVQAFGIGLQSKILSRRGLYPRSDAIVYYLPSADDEVLGALAAAHRPPAPQTRFSRLTAPLDGRLTLAHSPSDPRPGMQGLSFGEHRCRLLAHELLEHGELDPDRTRSAFVQAGVDPQAIAFNQGVRS